MLNSGNNATADLSPDACVASSRMRSTLYTGSAILRCGMQADARMKWCE